MRATRWLLALTALLVAQGAEAQMVTCGPTDPQRAVGARDNRPDTISHGDCLAADQLTFHLSLFQYEAFLLQVWIGPNCASDAPRT